MNNKSLLNEKEAGKENLHQPQQVLINEAAQPERLVEGKSTLERAAEQEETKTAVQELLSNYYSPRIVTDVKDNGDLITHNQTLEEYLEKTYRRKIYQLGRSKRFLYLVNNRWWLITPEVIKAEYVGRGVKHQHAVSHTRADIAQTVEVCRDFGQIIWNQNIKELQGKEVAK